MNELPSSLPTSVFVTQHLNEIAKAMGKEYSFTLVIAHKSDRQRDHLFSSIMGSPTKVWEELKPDLRFNHIV